LVSLCTLLFINYFIEIIFYQSRPYFIPVGIQMQLVGNKKLIFRNTLLVQAGRGNLSAESRQLEIALQSGKSYGPYS
jgi:hypothetical protein